MVVAPGPSLAKNIHVLAELSQKLYIIALGHSLAALYEAGIRPDFMVHIDPESVLPEKFFVTSTADMLLVLGTGVPAEVAALPSRQTVLL